MTLMARREVVRAVSARCALARGHHKTRILDEFTASTGFARKHTIAVLRKPPESQTRLTALYTSLDPVALRLQIEPSPRHICQHRRVRLFPVRRPLQRTIPHAAMRPP
jgi:hypothetical protein